MMMIVSQEASTPSVPSRPNLQKTGASLPVVAKQSPQTSPSLQERDYTRHHWSAHHFLVNEDVADFVQSDAAYRTAQILTVAIPASSIVAGKLSDVAKGKPSPTNFNAAVHGLNPGADSLGLGKSLSNGAEVLSTYSSDFSKMVQNFWRLTTVLPTDVMRWGFRGFSQIYIQPLLELVRLNSRALVAPAIQQTLLPTYKNKSIAESKDLYPHLTHGQHYQLAKEMEGKHLTQLGGLFNVLTENAAGTRFEHLPRAMDDLTVDVRNTQGRWVKQSLRQAYPTLCEHLSLLANPDTIMADRATIAKYGVDHFPVMRMHKIENDNVKNLPKVDIQARIFNGPVGAFRHMKATQLDAFMPQFYAHLELAARGQFTREGKNATQVDRSSALASLSIGMDKSRERENRTTHALVEYLTSFMQLKEGDATKTHHAWIPGLPSMFEELKRNYKLKLMKQNNTFEKDPTLLREMISNLREEELMLGYDRKNTLHSTFDPKDKLGLKASGKSSHMLAKEIAPVLDALSTIVQESHELTLDKTINAETYQKRHVHLLEQFEHERLKLGHIFPGKNADNYNSLTRALSGYGKDSIVYNTTQWMLRSRNAMQFRTPELKNSIVLPQVILNALLGFGFLSLVWNALDVHQIQPYEYNVSQKKGDVKGSGGLMLLSVIPGASLFTGLMSNGLLRTLTKNSPLKRFVISSSLGVATATALAYELVHGAMRRKKDNPRAKGVTLKANLEIFHHNHHEIKELLQEHQREYHSHSNPAETKRK
jgi:hypothetical protein